MANANEDEKQNTITSLLSTTEYDGNAMMFLPENLEILDVCQYATGYANSKGYTSNVKTPKKSILNYTGNLNSSCRTIKQSFENLTIAIIFLKRRPMHILKITFLLCWRGNDKVIPELSLHSLCLLDSMVARNCCLYCNITDESTVNFLGCDFRQKLDAGSSRKWM